MGIRGIVQIRFGESLQPCQLGVSVVYYAVMWEKWRVGCILYNDSTVLGINNWYSHLFFQ